MQMADKPDRPEPLKELAKLYFRLGLTSFGGPAAHIAMMEDEVVTRRKWLTRETFVDLIGATNLIPGPNSTEMAIHVGFMRAGIAGLIVAGASFILPSAVATGIVAWLYFKYGSLPQVIPFLQGIKPVVIAIIALAAFRLGKTAIKKRTELMIVAAAVFAAFLLGFDPIYALFAGGILGGLWINYGRKLKSGMASLAPLFGEIVSGTPASAIPAAGGVTMLSLFLTFLKVGAVLFGGGYVLIALLQNQIVNGLGWITQKQLIDAIAVGQFTPGPVLSAATFIGYQIHGLSGAIAATIAIFLPSFIFVAIVNPFVPKLRRSKFFSAFLDAVNASSIALIAGVAVRFAITSLNSWLSISIFATAALLPFKWNVNSAWLVAGGGLLGLLGSLIR